MAFINSVASWFLKKRIHQIDLFLKYPHDVQFEWFQNLINAGRNTIWGQKYDFDSINSPEDFRAKVPISDYESLRPWIERVRSGEQDVLWPGETRWFAKSSGTTGDKSKFIPVTEDSLEDCHYKAGKDMLSIYFNNNPDSEILAGKNIAVAGTSRPDENSDAYVGDLSAILMNNLPLWAMITSTPNRSISLMDEWEEKVRKIAELTIQEDVRVLTGVPSWMLVIIKKVLELSGKENISEVWPNFELVVHGGVSFLPYKEQFKKLMPPHTNYLEVYNASEGFFGIQDKPNQDDLLLLLDYGIYYEFVPMEEWGKENMQSIMLKDVELGKNYAIVISTNGGLWRYLIGDTVVFTSINPYRIKISGRMKHHINVVGEELMVDNADHAMSIACEKTHAVISEYTATPKFLENGHVVHKWLVEFEKEPLDLEYFAEVFDNALKSLNSDYEAKRYHSMVLQFPEIIALPKGSFYAWLKSRGKIGGQFKVPRLSNSNEYYDEILKMTEK